MTELRVLKENQAEFFKTMEARGYSAISFLRYRFALAEFFRFAESGEKIRKLISDDAIVQFLDWKLRQRQRLKYHPGYRSKVTTSLQDFLQWYLARTKKRAVNMEHLKAMSQVFIEQSVPGYPRWPIEVANRHERFFEYLQKINIKDLRKISPATFSDFHHRRERAFYRGRQKYRSEYAQSVLQTPLKNYFSFLESRAIIKPYEIKPYEIKAGVSPTLLDEVLESYIEFCEEARGLVPTSVLRIEKILRHFSVFLDHSGVVKIAEINIGQVDSFCQRRTMGRSAKTTENSVLRRFLKWLYLEGQIKSDLSLLIICPRKWALSEVPDFLDEDELSRLLDFGSLESSPVNELNRCLVLVLLFSGIRIGEAAKLEIDDIQWDQKTAVIRDRKNRQDLLIPLSAPAIEALRRYLAQGRPKGVTSKRVFFTVNAPIRPVSPRGLSQNVLRYFIQKKVRGGAHRLRHTFAQRLLDSGSSLEEVQALLGQESVNSTRIYAKTSMVRMREFILEHDS